MPNFLSKIIEHKKEEIAEARKKCPEKQLKSKAARSPKKRPFFKQLEKPGAAGANIIAEIKRASPSKGNIRIDLDSAAYAAEYQKGGAATLSVLTDRSFFKGCFDDLKKARDATTLPVLRKDFLISSYQIYESSVIGADAVLLIARILSKIELRDLLMLSGELGMDALVEINSEKDLESANFAGARLIGINNRNLGSFQTDIETSVRLVSLLDQDQVAVAASGIKARHDMERIKGSGIWNFLIGESIVRAKDPCSFIKSLLEPA